MSYGPIRLAILALATLVTPAAFAGTQDFVLVNQTGVVVNNLYISESENESWEEDVLGDKVLPNGNRVNVGFKGRTACLWDMMVADADGNQVTWTGIDLCKVSVVVLRCNDSECWAETE